MKYFALLSLFLICSCAIKNKSAEFALKKSVILSDCPKDATCEIIVNNNKAMVVKTDEFGKIYYELIDNKDKNVLVYSYYKTVPKGMQDGHYKEDVVIEINKNIQDGAFSDFSDKGMKVLFGRFCYCKGYTGNYKIDNGMLKITTKNKQYHFDFNFTVKEVPQIIKNIQFVIE